jgi:hypothetical protein
LNAVLVTHIGVNRQSFGKLAHFRGGLLGQIGVEVRDNDFGFFFCKGPRRVFADPLPTACYDDDLILQHTDLPNS